MILKDFILLNKNQIYLGSLIKRINNYDNASPFANSIYIGKLAKITEVGNGYFIAEFMFNKLSFSYNKSYYERFEAIEP